MAPRQLALCVLAGALPRPSPTRLPMLYTSLSIRPYNPSSKLSMAQKDSQENDRHTLDPRPSEGTKSGSDYDVADHGGASFDGRVTKPEETMERFQRENNGNPLEFSGANRNISETSIEKEGTREKQIKSSSSPGKKKGNLLP